MHLFTVLIVCFLYLLMNPHCESSLLWRMPYTCTNSMDYWPSYYYSNIKRDREAYRLGRREAYKSWRISGLSPFYSSTVLHWNNPHRVLYMYSVITQATLYQHDTNTRLLGTLPNLRLNWCISEQIRMASANREKNCVSDKELSAVFQEK